VLPILPDLRRLLPLLLLPWLGDAAAESGAGAPVSVTLAREQDISEVIQVTGMVTSARDARLSVSIGGLVTALHVDAGSRVTAGDLLLNLDPELAELQWRSAEAGAEEARNALEDARRRLEEARALAPQRSIAETVVRDLAAEVAEDEAALHRAEAEAGYRRGILARHELRAPFAGVVSERLADLGEWVDPGQAVFNLVATEELRLDFEIPEDYLADVTTETPVTFTLNPQPEAVHPGKVAAVVPVTRPGTRTFLVRVEAVALIRWMIPGMSARARLTLATGRRGLVVPRDALQRFPDGRLVIWVVEPGPEGTVAAEKLVQIGLAFEGLVEVRSGLEPGARVVIEGNESLQSGQRVLVSGGGT
jgi:RND family efflux transporter MFP subunit